MSGKAPLLLALALASGCAGNPRVTEGAAVGGAAGAAVGAVAPGISVIEGSAVGSAIGGLAGAVWSDANNDGYVDGYTYNGQYYAGTPEGYDPATHSVRAGALGGASLGASGGAAIPGVGVLQGAVIGAVVGGLNGGRWADRNNDGQVDGYVYKGQYYAGAPAAAAPLPSPSPAPVAMPPGLRDEGPPGCSDCQNIAVPGPRMLASGERYMAAAIGLGAIVRAVRSGERGQLADVGAWQTMNGALAPRALVAILQQCVADFDEVGPDCLAAVRAGAGAFSAVPGTARREFAEIYKDSCSANVQEDACVEKLQNAAMFRALPRGGLQLSPLRMDERKRTLFTALIRDSGEIEGQAGLSTNIGFEPDASHPGQQHRITVVPYSPKMCFDLRADDPAKVKIEPQPGDRRTIERQTRLCMTEADEMGAVKYDPSWWVTPLSGDDIRLYLTIEHYVGQEKRDFPQEPWPIVIDVIPKPGWWDRSNAFFKNGKEWIDNATAFVKALGALFSAIAAWGIWSLIKKMRAVPS